MADELGGKARTMAPVTSASSCGSCRAVPPADAQFCPRCGAHLAHGETLELPADPVLADPRHNASQTELPPTLHRIHRRPLHLQPLPVLGGLGGVLLLFSIVLLATGTVLGGLVVLALAFALLLACARSALGTQPDTPLARQTLRAADRSRSMAQFSALTIRARMRAALELLRIQRRQQSLRRAIQDRLAPLGEAVYRGEDERAEALKQEVAALEEQLQATEQEALAVQRSARAEIDRERVTVQRTEVLPTAAPADGPAEDAAVPSR